MHLLDFYLSKLPPEALAKDIFYVRPLDVLPANATAPWYSATPVGSRTLSKKVKDMCQKAGVQGHKTNHSLRATGASSMYEAEVPETPIQERTGHRSMQALRVYERSTEKQHQAVSAVLSSTSHASFHKEMSSVDQNVHCAPSGGAASFSFSNLHGCTINITSQPQNCMMNNEEEFDKQLCDAIETELL